MLRDFNADRRRRRSQSAKSPGLKSFPRQERNYILMELASPIKELSRRSSLESNVLAEQASSVEKEETTTDSKPQTPIITINDQPADPLIEESQVDSNINVEKVVEDDEIKAIETHSIGIEDDLEKSILDARERSSDSSSDGEWKSRELDWEELGLVDQEVLDDFHNKVNSICSYFPRSVVLII